MGSKTNAFENDVLAAALGLTCSILSINTARTPYVALFTATPGEAGGGTEATGGSYARVNSSGKWATPSGGSVANNAVITFPTATADWGTIVAVAIFDAASGGNMVYWSALTANRTVLNGDTFSFPASSFTITED